MTKIHYIDRDFSACECPPIPLDELLPHIELREAFDKINEQFDVLNEQSALKTDVPGDRI